MEQSVFVRAITRLLTELFDGTSKQDGFILNPGDVGLLRQLDTIAADQASQRPDGRASIAAQVDHVAFGLSLLNRWAAGEKDPFTSANWEASWQRTSVTEPQWRELRNHLTTQARTWQRAVPEVSNWDDLAAAGAIASVAHTAYHLASIRHLLSSVRGAAAKPS